MGTISQKLEYLDTTREKIKDGINALGGELTNESTFRSYANVLNDLYEELPKVTNEETDEDITLNNTRKGKMVLDLKGNTYQDSTSISGGDEYDSPTPDHPQPIHNVSGDNEIKVCNKNLFDKSKNINETYTSSIATALQHYINTGEYARGYVSNELSISNNNNYVTSFTKCFSGKTYTIKNTYSLAANFSSVCFLDNNGNIINRNSAWSNNPYTHTATSEEKYIMCGFNINDSGVDYRNYVQIENGSTATEYVEHQEYTKEINLGELEVGGIGDYDDEFFKNTIDSEYYDSTLELDKWYLKKRIGKVVLDGSESWDIATATGFQAFVLNGAVNTSSLIGFSNYYNNFASSNWTYMQNNDFIVGRNNNQIIIRNDNISTTSDFETWLSTHNTIVYYVLATPTNTEITDTTLIGQLDNIEKLMSYEGQTNISQTNNDLPFKIKASALKKWETDSSNLSTLNMSRPTTTTLETTPSETNEEPISLEEE